MANTNRPTAETINEPGQFDTHVNLLVKNPSTIVYDDFKRDLAHMHRGVIGEIDELEECIHNIQQGGLEEHAVNFIEELGDLLFYATRMKYTLRPAIMEIEAGLTSENYDKAFFEAVSEVVKSHGVIGGNYQRVQLPGLNLGVVHQTIFARFRAIRTEMNETVKRYIDYGETRFKGDGDYHAHSLFDITAKIMGNIAVLATSTGVSMEAVKAHNFTKLGSRYPDGYSDEAASARADKVEEEGCETDALPEEGTDNVTPFKKPESVEV